MNKKLFSKLMVLTLTLSAATSQAKLFTMTVTHHATLDAPYTGFQNNYNTAIDQVVQDFSDQVNANAGTGSLGINQYFTGLGNATSMANSGLGASYANNFKYFTFGAGAGFGGVLADGKNLFDLKSGIQGNLSGVGAGASLMAGANAGLLFKQPWFWGLVDPTRLKGYLGLFFFPISLKGFGSGNVTSVSTIGQYQLIPSSNLATSLVKWNGVNISSGLRFAKFKLDASYSKTVTDNENLSVGGQTLDTTLSTPIQIDLDINSTTTTMPFEATTSIRLAYFLTLFAGTAFDLNVGSSSGGVTAPDTTVTISHSANPVTHDTTTADVATDHDYATGSGHPTLVNWRAMGGFQVEFGIGGVYVVLQKAILKPQYAAQFGLNLFY